MFAMIPLGEFTTAKAFYNDEREQFFSNSLHPELYGDRLTATSLAFGGGIRLRDDLSIGTTFTLSLANDAAAPVYVSNLNDLQTVLLDSDIAVKAAVAPHLGVAWRPVKPARVIATVHTEQAFRISTGFNYTLASGSEQSTVLHFTHSYMPLTVAAGVERDFTVWGSRFQAGLDVVGHRLVARHVTKFIGDGSDPELVIDEVPDDAIDVLGGAVPNRTGLQTNNPGFPGFESSGWIFGAGVRLAVEFGP